MNAQVKYALGIRKMLWTAALDHHEHFHTWPKRVMLPPAVFADLLSTMTNEERAIQSCSARPPGQPNQIYWRALLIIEDYETSAAKLINHNNEVEYL